MSRYTSNQYFSVITNFTDWKDAEAALDEIINPIADAAVTLVKNDEQDEPREEWAQTEAAEELADTLESSEFDEVYDYLKESIDFVRSRTEGDESITIQVSTSSEEGISNEVFEGLIYRLAKLAKGNYSIGFFSEESSRCGAYGYEWLITKDGDYHRMDSLAEIALAGI
ncbi:hypothetical protein OAL32_01985 [Synechococcus sp. AH-551-G15]|nr:hypothetical protein [Synechococcus sp. AH-551-G15]